MRTILVSGAANGLGAAFIAAYAQQPETRILAIDKNPIQTSHDNVSTSIVDLTEESTISAFASSIKGIPIDLVLHSAGVRGLVTHLEKENHGNVAACETLDVMDVATLMSTFQINAVGTFLLIRAILPNLRLSQREHSSPPKVIVMSSRMGSLGNNRPSNGKTGTGSAYAYRASKAATNAMIRSFACDVPEADFIMIHPGRVESGLVRWKEEGAISPEESLKTLLPMIENFDHEDNGKFYDRFGEQIEW